MQSDGLKTTDVHLAAFALTRGARLVGVDRADPRRVVFHMDGEVSAEDLAAYAMGEAEVKVGPFVANLRHLKRRIFG